MEGPVQLLVLRGSTLVASHALEALPLSVGAAPSCDLVLEGEGVPERAGEIRRGADGLRLVDEPGGTTRRLKPGRTVGVGELGLVLLPGAEAQEPGRHLEPVLDLVAALGDPDAGEEPFVPLLEALLRLFGARWGAIVRAEEPEDPEVVAHAGSRPAGAGARVSTTVLRQLAAQEGSVLGEDLVEGEGLGAAASIPGEVRSVLAARLVHGAREEGVIYLESPRAARAFGAEEGLLLERLGALAAAALARTRRTRRLDALHHADVAREHDVTNIVGESAPMEALREEIARAASADVTGLILGASGTGKELVAKAIHAGSARAPGPFVALNCAAIPTELVESELFGHTRGAFSGADRARVGRFEMADGGTLFLDELADLSLDAQAKILRALEEREVLPVGADAARPVDVRVLAATHADLEEAVEGGRFRKDLYFRLAVFVIEVPPLACRGEDVRQLAEHFLAHFARKHGREVAGFEDEALRLLVRHPWPGNVRELRNVVEQACIREEGPRVTAASLAATSLAPPEEYDAAGPLALAEARALFERRHIVRALEEEGGDMAAVQRRLEVSQTTLYDRCRDLSIDHRAFRR